MNYHVLARPQVLRLPNVIRDYGVARSTIYKLVHAGLWPRPIKLTGKASGWIAAECDAVLAARIRGKSDDDIRKLVASLASARENAGAAA